jgi:hypothetical protein
LQYHLWLCHAHAHSGKATGPLFTIWARHGYKTGIKPNWHSPSKRDLKIPNFTFHYNILPVPPTIKVFTFLCPLLYPLSLFLPESRNGESVWVRNTY